MADVQEDVHSLKSLQSSVSDLVLLPGLKLHLDVVPLELQHRLIALVFNLLDQVKMWTSIPITDMVNTFIT